MGASRIRSGVVNNGGARIRELQRAITSLRGVRGARVQLDASGVGHVRVLVVPERDVAQTVSDVREAVLRRLRVDIDPERIEVVVAGRAAGVSLQPRRRKLALLAIERENGRFTARVALDLDGDRLIGASQAPSLRKFERRSVAGAVLEGIKELIDQPVHLDEVALISMGDVRLAVVTVLRGSHTLIGSALVRNDEHDAIARATLHATNRVLP